MADYTIELRHVIENHDIFNFKYPFYDERKRPDFEEKFIRHFYFREICTPSIDRFIVYLNDKMNTVFPYYNELFNAAAIEYSVLDNYSLTEEFTSTIENEGKTSGISSSVGQATNNQVSKYKNKRTTDTTGNVSDTSQSETENDNNVSSRSETNFSGNTVTQTDKGETDQNIKKFLDTPQGLTDLTGSNYLTSLTQDNGTHDSEETADQTTNNTTTTTGNEITSGTSTQTNTHASESISNEAVKDGGSTTITGEDKTTHDNNTRTYSDGKRTESHTLKRKGNIGVDTDSDMIEKHIRLQKTLKQIELLFFNECEDLFMMVY